MTPDRTSIVAQWAVHSYHAAPVEIDERGTYTLNGHDRIPLNAPLFTGTKEECEEWLAERRLVNVPT